MNNIKQPIKRYDYRPHPLYWTCIGYVQEDVSSDVGYVRYITDDFGNLVELRM